MRKFFSALSFVLFLCFSGHAQTGEATDTALVTINEALKKSLTEKLKLSDENASKIVLIENDFHAKLKSINALGTIPVKEKEVKLNQAHVARRTALLAIPLTGRLMEDVVELSDHLWHVNKR